MTKQVKWIAIYVRVSSKKQDTASQLPDLQRYQESAEEPVKVYTDKASGKTMDRKGWRRLEADMRSGKVSTVVVWRLDRLGRTASGLTALFDELQRLKVNLVSLRDGIDLSTASGRLMANVLASVAAFENEVRSERVIAGQKAARAKGKTWGGSKPGVRKKVQPAVARTILRMKDAGESVSEISRTVKLSRPTIYNVLQEAKAAG